MDLLVERDNQKKDFGDMIFVNGVCPVTSEFRESVAQKVFILLRTFENEWYLNASTGIPYIPRILGQKVKKSTVDRILQEKILGVEGVADVISYSSSLGNDRTYSASFTLRTTQGEVFSEQLEIQ